MKDARGVCARERLDSQRFVRPSAVYVHLFQLDKDVSKRLGEYRMCLYALVPRCRPSTCGAVVLWLGHTELELRTL